MVAPSRTGDIGKGTCPAHPKPVSYVTVYISAQNTVTVEGQTSERIGDIGIASCGHPTVALTGSATSSVVGSPPHRVGDAGSNPGPYVSVTGATKTEVPT